MSFAPLALATMQQKRRVNWLGFDTYVAPDGFDRTAQAIDIYDIFCKYATTRPTTAKCIYSVSDTVGTITLNRYGGQNGVWPAATSYRYGYTSGGVDYQVDAGAYTTLRVGGADGYYTRVEAVDVSAFPDSGTIRIKNVCNFVYTSLDKTPGSNAFIGASQYLTQQNATYGIDLIVTINWTGTTKRWVICNHLPSATALYNYVIPANGSVWLFCGNFVTGLSLRAQTYLKYVHMHSIQTITAYGHMENIGATALTGTLHLSRNATITGDYIFQGCTEITKVIIPKEWTTTGNMSWRNCTKLATVEFESTSSLLTIGTLCFDGDSAITQDLVIPNSVKTIKSQAFQNCQKIPSLTLGSSVETIETSAFAGCNLMAGTLTIPSSVKTCGTTSFYNTNFSAIKSYSSYIKDDNNVLYDTYESGQVKAIYGARAYSGTLTLRSDTTLIMERAFYNNVLRTGDLTIPNTVTYIYSWAFYNCTGFSNNTLTLSNTLTTMELRAFQNIYFSSIIIPDSVTTIGDVCFYTAPTTLVIGSGLTSYSAGAIDLRNCTSLTGGSTTYPISDHVWYDCKTSGKVIAFDSAKKYSGTLTLRTDTTEISSYAFSGATRTGTLDIPSTVTKINAYAFYLSTFSNVTSSSSNYPAANDVLYDVTSGVIAIYGAKNNSGALTLRVDTTKIYDYAFYNNSWTGTVDIPSTVTNINTYGFYGCSGLTRYNLYPSTAPTITGTPFSGYNKPLHIPVSNSGYNVAPWTTAAIFTQPAIADL